MKLNHLNLVVNDIPATVRFFEIYFDFTCTDTRGNNVIAILKGDDGFVLVLMAANEKTANEYPDVFHIGFMQERDGQVQAIYEELLKGGIEVPNAPKRIRDGFGFYFHFDRLMIEVATLS